MVQNQTRRETGPVEGEASLPRQRPTSLRLLDIPQLQAHDLRGHPGDSGGAHMLPRGRKRKGLVGLTVSLFSFAPVSGG